MVDERSSVAPASHGLLDAERVVQDRLAHAIERAQVGEDRELAQEVRERGEQLANLLYGLLRTSRLYAAENKAFDAPVTELASCVARLTARLGPVTLVCVQDQVYVNDVRVRFGEKTGKPGELGVELSKHNVGGISFQEPPTDDHIRALITGFAQAPEPSSPRAALSRFLAARKATGIELGGINRFPKVGERSAGESGAREAREVVERADETIAGVWRNAAAGHMINALALRRMVAELLALGVEADEVWRAGADAPPHVAHAMRVNLLALTIGKAVGLPESVLQDLGVAAVLHDIGYTAEGAIPLEASHLAVHPIAGARALALRKGFHEAKVRRVLAALDHHRDHADPRGRPSLFGRILRIAEDFDNYCRPEGGGLSPAEALVGMLPGAGTRYDPVLLQLFVNRVGRFPPNTLLELDDGRVVETTSLVDEPASFGAPRAVVRRMPDGRPPKRVVIVDLAVEGRPRRLLRGLD
jgi:hypothetical protein